MREKVLGNKKLVFVEVADIFLEQDSFEEIPDEDQQPDEYARWLQVEHQATCGVVNKIIERHVKEGYRFEVAVTAERMTKVLLAKGYSYGEASLPFGLNGVLMLRFAAPTDSTVETAGVVS